MNGPTYLLECPKDMLTLIYPHQTLAPLISCSPKSVSLRVFPIMGSILISCSGGKESACNAGDPKFNSSVGKIPWRRDRVPTPVFLGFLVAQMAKNPPAVQETWVRSLGWEDPLEEGMATHSSIRAWRIPMDRGAWQVTIVGSQRTEHD